MPGPQWREITAALLFGAIGLWALRSDGVAMPRVPLVAALAVTALWALAVAGIGESDLVTQIAAAARNLAWFGFMVALYRSGVIERPPAIYSCAAASSGSSITSTNRPAGAAVAGSVEPAVTTSVTRRSATV